MPASPSPSNQVSSPDLLLLSGRDLKQLMRPAAALEALRATYGQLANNRADQGRSLGFAVSRGSIHVKAGLLPGSHAAFAAKVNRQDIVTGAERLDMPLEDLIAQVIAALQAESDRLGVAGVPAE